MKAPGPSGSVPSSPRGSPRNFSTIWRLRCCAPPDSTRPTRPPGWRRSGYPVWTACSTVWRGRWHMSDTDRPELLEFRVPDLGEGLEEATITGWSVAVGDEVELNQMLCTLETNKAEVEIPSPYAGRVA